MSKYDENRQTSGDIKSGPVFARAKITNGRATAVPIDASETYRVTQKTAHQIISPMTAATGANPNKTPAEVATPLPPRKQSQTGNECPTTHINPLMIFNSCAADSSKWACLETSIAKSTAAKPFIKSIAKTGNPYRFPRMRVTLVA